MELDNIKMMEIIKAEMSVYEEMADEATTQYERGEAAGALSALRHLMFMVRSMGLEEQ